MLNVRLQWFLALKLLRLISLSLLLLQPTIAQFPPALDPNSNVTVIKSPINGNITITYKTPPPGTCTTIFPSQLQYTGYVFLPPFTLAPIQQNYSINTFFWFIEARQKPEAAPLTIWLNGGPGTSSMIGLFLESGPCEVVELARDKFGTQARDWGWDRSSNLLYIDQPNEVGFSYDVPVNGSADLMTGQYIYPPSAPPLGQPAYTFVDGTFSSNNVDTTANTTEISARAVWHMLQGFLSAFPQYNPGTRPNSNLTGSVGVNLFTESYGGKFGPTFAAFWEQQNAARRNGSLPSNSTLEIKLRSLGIINGCIDNLVQAPSYPKMAYNNTYGIEAVSQDVALTAQGDFLSKDGCKDLIQQCETANEALDASDEGDVASVNDVCREAQAVCNRYIMTPYTGSERNIYDIAHKNPDPFPPSTYLEYLNTAEFQSAIGARTNYTETSPAVQTAFISTGDWQRGDPLASLSTLLSLNIRIALIYGDRDYICNWLGGETVSFALAGHLPQTYSPFQTAGYADIVVNESYVGGAVRQFGNLSFSRIYDAGHLVPAYQPETAFTVFTRIITGVDIATGGTVDLRTFGTKGEANSSYTTDEAPSSPEPTCWIRNIGLSCTDRQKSQIRNNEGVVINGVLYEDERDWKPPKASVTDHVGVPGTFPTSAIGRRPPPSGTSTGGEAGTSTGMATGVYVATEAPKSTKKAAAVKRDFNTLLLTAMLGSAMAFRLAFDL
ncbi:MAG: hypothetical protein M1817_005898 [Caeruleum heppii]|nr:MAG: hypothetical protein M1817_005898 [Caeruleum heppii]